MIISQESIYSKFQEHPVISTDSRKIPPGCLFFALKGENFNGNLFARQALSQGAAFAVIDEEQIPSDPRFLVVENVLETLQKLAHHHHRQSAVIVIAITGTNGKTTSKELINAVLSKKFRTTATQGNLNNHIGVPLTLLAINRETEIAIIEMGANHPGEIDFLCRLAEPDYGLITNIGKAHLEGFGGYDGVIRTKTELYRYIRDNGGTLVVNKDNPLLMKHAAGIPAITYGKPPAMVSMNSVSANPFVEMELSTEACAAYFIKSKLYGGYNAQNILAAACIGEHFGVESEKIVEAIESFEPSNNRSQILKTTSNLLIMDAYNANPSSMEAAITTFSLTSYENKVVILGDMRELGEETDSEHLRLLEFVAGKKFSEVYLVGPVFTRLNTHRENHCFDDSDLAAIWFTHHPIEGCTILIKGSRGIRLETVMEKL